MEIKIEAAVEATDDVARELWMRPVASELAKEGEETKPTEYEDAYPAQANGYRVFPVDENGRPVDWHDLEARRRGGIVHVLPSKDVTPNPKSTFEKPLPPLEVKDVTKFFVVGQADVKVAVEAKLTATRAADVAKAALIEAEPVEAEALAAGGVIKR